ncbi:MAG: ATP-binding protein [Nitrospirota bacterium]
MSTKPGVLHNAQKELLRIALFNMLRNAIEVSPEGGRVAISTSRANGSVVFSVCDSGKGIPATDLDKIFAPSYSSKIYSFGMGLPLIKQIVSEHMGEMGVDSVKGQGTTFRVIFPFRWKLEPGKVESVV